MFVLPKANETISEFSEFRRVLWTGRWQSYDSNIEATLTIWVIHPIGEHSQLVSMTIPVGGEIGEETHTVDQVLTFTSGSAKVGP
jgi:quercetin dioxygenase-like cupin family protein